MHPISTKKSRLAVNRPALHPSFSRLSTPLPGRCIHSVSSFCNQPLISAGPTTKVKSLSLVSLSLVALVRILLVRLVLMTLAMGSTSRVQFHTRVRALDLPERDGPLSPFLVHLHPLRECRLWLILDLPLLVDDLSFRISTNLSDSKARFSCFSAVLKEGRDLFGGNFGTSYQASHIHYGSSI
ncbi:hypothetical protein BDM02DRAFT_2887259 [Thelephora ganbajun]|uniref:Uncharacterized protein n=1 Tax=Thelephora ganbajun TaxID=370292 RepID=A0ACB6ZBN5_THEGA|nr:hypothetical protein BDM02DRAFT_2887259 [Thelephora ganbajun]